MFGQVPHLPDEPNWQGEFRVIDIGNRGETALAIADISMRGSERFRLRFPQPTPDEIDIDLPPDPANDIDEWPRVLGADSTFPIRVWFAPDSGLAETAEMVITLDDARATQHVVYLSANSDRRCMEVVSGEMVDFGQVAIGQTSKEFLTIENCSRSSVLEVSDIQLIDDGSGAYAVEAVGHAGELPSQAVAIEPGERENLVVTFAPSNEGSYDGVLSIRSDDLLNSSKVIDITGEGADDACPTAEARAWVQGDPNPRTTIETTPLGTIMFDAPSSADPGSADPDSGIAGYEWTIVSRPKGSTQRLLPNRRSPEPRLFLDVVGTYEIALRVYDDEGTSSCGEPAIVTIVATPEDDIYLQLVWDTPSDTEQTDTFGADLELHYKHESGRWDSAPWDIFWRNPTQDWGLEGDSSDDPFLELDDTDGAGPEVIRHHEPEDAEYRVGVYHGGSHYFRGSYATLRVFIDGALALELADEYVPGVGTFWEAALIEWPGATVTDISQKHWQFPESP